MILFGKVPTSIYTIIAISIVAFWPIGFLGTNPTLTFATGLPNLALLAWAWKSCASEKCGYWQGFNVIGSSLSSGCLNITILYAPLVLCGIYITSVYYALRGLVSKDFSQKDAWNDRVIWFYNMRNFGKK